MHTVPHSCGHVTTLDGAFNGRRPEDSLSITSNEPCDACKPVTYSIYVDGGCSNNQHADKAVGYYSIAIIDSKGIAHAFTIDDVKSSVHDHLPLPEGMKQTNNVAELYAWLIAFDFITEWSERAREKGKKLPEVVVKGDSEYVVNWLNGKNQKAKANTELVSMLRETAKVACGKGRVTFMRVDRSEIVEILGH